LGTFSADIFRETRGEKAKGGTQWGKKKKIHRKSEEKGRVKFGKSLKCPLYLIPKKIEGRKRGSSRELFALVRKSGQEKEAIATAPQVKKDSRAGM